MSTKPGQVQFWSEIRRLAVHLENERTTPTKMELIIESIQEAVDDRIDDARGAIQGAGKAAGAVASGVGDAVAAVAETGSKLWSGIKIAGLVALGLVGAVIVVPPIVRAIRD